MSEKFFLKWNDFHSNVSNTFRKLRMSDHFYDVTLVSDDQQQVSAHKIILSSSSEYFKNILTSNTHSHPMLCLNGVNALDMKNVLDFIYNGEIQIYQDHLDQFLNIAQRFKLEGLLQNEEESNFEQFKEENNSSKENDIKEPMICEVDDERKVSPVKPPHQKIIAMESANFENIEELDQKINDMIENTGDGWRKRRCIPCGKISRDMSDARHHAETHIDGLSFPCQYCSKTFRSRHALKVHISSRCLHK